MDLCNLAEFLILKILEIQYLLHLRYKYYKITFVESYSWGGGFQQCQECAPISLIFLVLI